MVKILNSMKVHGGSGIPFGFVETKLGSEKYLFTTYHMNHMI